MNLELNNEVESTVHLYTPAMMAQTLRIPVSAVRLWYRKGLIQPVRVVLKIPYFDYPVLSLANTFAHWMRQGLSAQSIAQQFTSLAALQGKRPQEIAAALSISVEGKRLVLQKGNLRVEANGQLQLSFDSEFQEEDSEPITVKFTASTAEASASLDIGEVTGLLDIAMDAEDREDLERAAQIYRDILALYGPNADVCFQLAEVLYRQADLGAARERYYSAIELDPSLVEARANLGCVLAELGQMDAAVSQFQIALEQHAEYADVHFHLARALDLQGLSVTATQHWQKFLELAPASPWADEARSRLVEEPRLDFEP